MGLFPCSIDVAPEKLKSGSGCADAGIDVTYAADQTHIDLPTMNDTPANFKDADGNVTAFALRVGTHFVEVGYNEEGSSYTSTKQEDGVIYEHELTALLTGKSAAQTAAIETYLGNCKGQVLTTFTSNCQARVHGLKWNKKREIFEFGIGGESMKIGVHTDTHGTFGGDEKARDEFTWKGRSKGAAAWYMDTEAVFRAAYVDNA